MAVASDTRFTKALALHVSLSASAGPRWTTLAYKGATLNWPILD